MQLFKHEKVNLTWFWYISSNSKSKANILIKKLSSILLSWNYVFSGFFKNIYLNWKYYGIEWVVMGLEVFGMLSRPSSFSISRSPRYTVVYFQNSIFLLKWLYFHCKIAILKVYRCIPKGRSNTKTRRSREHAKHLHTHYNPFNFIIFRI